MGCSGQSVNCVWSSPWLVRGPVSIEFRRDEFQAFGATNASHHHHTLGAICLLRLDAYQMLHYVP
jgi:hypothetical protein